MDDITTSALDWDAADWGNHVRVDSHGSWVGAEAA